MTRLGQQQPYPDLVPPPPLKIELSVGVASASVAERQGGRFISAEARQIVQRASACAEANDWNEAAGYYRKLSELLPWPQSYTLLGTAYFKLGDYHRAANAFRRAVKLRPNDPGLLFNLGLMYLSLQKNTRSLQCLREVIKLDRTEGEAYFYIGYIHSRRAQWQLAVDAYEEAIRLRKDFQPAYLYLADLYARLGRGKEGQRAELFSRAIATYKKLLEIHPRSSAAYNNMGVLYSELGDSQAALEAYENAVELDPSNETAIQNLRLIKEARLQRRLYELGFLKETREPITDLTPYQNRRVIEVRGRPLSESLLEERR